MKFLCDQCKTKYQIADEKAAGKTLRMKCRKCGHLIEIRAAVSASVPPPAVAPAPSAPEAPRGPPPRPAPRPGSAPLASSLTSSLTTNFTSARPAPARPDKPAGALAGAFKTTVRDDEVSAPFDMSDLSGNDEWYVAVNGVPVGPIRVAEIRRRAANGAVTEDSLAWQEGLDEWRPVRSFPDLAAVVRDAIASGRPSLTPHPPDARPSHAPPRSTASARSSVYPPGAAPRARPHTQSETSIRSNVVPISSRLATAERLAEPEDIAVPIPSEPPRAEPAAMAVADPFAALPPARPAEATFVEPPRERKRPIPWIPIAMVAGAMAFGVTAGIAAFSRPAPTQQIIYQQVPAAAPTASASAAPSPTAADSAQATDTTGPTPKAAVAMGGPKSATPAASTTTPSKSLDLHNLLGSHVSPVDDSSGDGQRAAGQCLTSGQVQQVVGMHTVAVRRACWDRNPSTKPAANVSVSLTVAGDGSTQGVSASGDEISVAKCIENDARQWRFPAMGCSQAVSIPFHFVRQ